MKKANVLIVDQDINLFNISSNEWGKYCIDCTHANNLTKAIQILLQEQFALIVIVAEKSSYNDVLEFLNVIRGMSYASIVISSHDHIDAEFKIRAHEQGVLDIWQMPDNINVAVAKGGAIIREQFSNKKKNKNITVIIRFPLVLVVETRTVVVNGKNIELNKKEFDILHMLAAYPDRVFTHEQIYKEVWGDEDNENINNTNNIIFPHITRIKNKLNIEPGLPEFITNIRGIGYRFEG